LRADLVPEDLRSKTVEQLRDSWPRWARERDRAIRERLDRGERDSIANLVLFGTTFTKHPRPATPTLAAINQGPSRMDQLLEGRLDDFVAALALPRLDERLNVARMHLERHGIDLKVSSGSAQARAYLSDSIRIASAEYLASLPSTAAADQPRTALIERTMFRDRGLSSDTSIFINLAVDQALETIVTNKLLGPGGAHRVGIVGPGLDFADKHDGHDFYPPQTIQPFALADTLIRLGLADPGELRLTTFDVSPRINDHLGTARRRADAKGEYVLMLPRNMDMAWEPLLVAFWEQLGLQIGKPVERVAVPANAGNAQVRAVRIDPVIVRLITPEDVNIVLQRLELPTDAERFDLIVATDVLLYYDVFEQSLALVNIARMLRPGGLLLSNSRLFELPSIPLEAVGSVDVLYMTVPGVGPVHDRVNWYRRQ
jgi:SAM-dependent methyltransferase